MSFLFDLTAVVTAVLVALLLPSTSPGAPSGQGVALTSTTVTALTPDGKLRVNNRPHFFIGTAPGPPLKFETPEGRDGWDELAEGGINVVRGNLAIDDNTTRTRTAVLAYLDKAAAHGVYVWPFLDKIAVRDAPDTEANLSAFVESFRAHPALFFWKLTDEPAWGKIPAERLQKAYRAIRAADPDHLVWITHAPRGTTESLQPYSEAADVLATDIYPVSEPPGKHSLEPNKELSMVGDYTRKTIEAAGPGKMVFMILQACWSGVEPRHNPRNKLMFPTFRQERYMMYQAIINGADSISFFGLLGGLKGRDAQLGFNWTFWRAVLKPLLAEIKPGSELYPVLTAPDTTYPLQFTGAPQIEARWKEGGGNYLYIFAAAREGSEQSVEFRGLDDGEVTVLFENRTLEARNGSFTDKFAQHDVHIYRALRKLPPGQGGGPADGSTTSPADGGYYVPPGATR